MIKLTKIAISTACFLGGLLKAPPLFLIVMIAIILMMFVSDLWTTMRPILKSIQRRNKFLYRKQHRSDWPIKPADFPAISYKEVTYEDALLNNPFLKKMRHEQKK